MQATLSLMVVNQRQGGGQKVEGDVLNLKEFFIWRRLSHVHM